jgi:hypothetical protein
MVKTRPTKVLIAVTFLLAALPENRHRQVQRLLYGSRSQTDHRRNGPYRWYVNRTMIDRAA